MTGTFEFKTIACPVCGGSDSRFVGYRGGEAHHSGFGEKTTIVRCAQCSHQYPNPMPFPTVRLSTLYGSAEDYFASHDLERKKAIGLMMMAEFERRLGRKGRLLDIACGRGEILWAAREAGWEFEGVDTSQAFIEFGKQKLGVEARLGKLEDVQFPDESFDAIVMTGIVEHLYDPSSTLREVARVLRPHGWFYIDAPNEDGLYMVAGNAYMRFQGKQAVVVLAPTFSPFHVQGFNPKSLKYHLEAMGFVVREFTMTGEVSPQVGRQSVRRRLEFQAARFVNWVGNLTGKAMYMYVWAQKK